jgi:hypothetical protein
VLGHRSRDWPLRVGGGRGSDQAETTRRWAFGTESTPRRGGLLNVRVRDKEDCDGEKERKLSEGTGNK